MPRILPTSLTGRLIVTVVTMTALVAVLVGTAVTLVMHNSLTDRLNEQLEQSVGRARMDLLRNQPQFGGNDRPGAPPGQSVGLITVIDDGSSAPLSSYINREGDTPEVSTAAQKILGDVPPDDDSHHVDLPVYGSYRAIAIGQGGVTTVVALPTDDVDATVASLIWWEILLGLGATAAAGLVGRTLVRRQLQPLREVANAAHEVVAMPLSSGAIGQTVRVPEALTDSSTEVGQVGEALNQLLRHVEEALDARHESEQQARTFLADASHELRTPLATIAGYAELSRRTGRADPDQILAKVESEAGRMSSLVEDMLLLARLDAGRELERHDVDLTRLVVEAVDDARVVDPERQWSFDVPDDPITVSGDEQRLHQAVTNLLTNASRHTPPTTVVTARVRRESDAVSIEIHDKGPGIDPAQLPTLFERFTRGDSSRTRASGGAGLGMSLVRAIMHGHGGTATVTSQPGNTTFILRIPISV